MAPDSGPDDDSTDEPDSPAELRHRVAQLEQTVATQQEAIEEAIEAGQPASVGRRSILASVLAAAGLGSLGTYGATRASAQASGPGGLQGTPEEPNEMHAWTLDVYDSAEFNGNPLTGVGALETDSLDSRQGYQDVTGSRSVDTWYQNTTGADLDVNVELRASSDGTRVIAEMDVNDSQTGLLVSRFDDTLDASGGFTLTATVPDDYYHRVTLSGDTADINLSTWVEQQ